MPATTTRFAPTELTLPAVPVVQLGPLHAADAVNAARWLPGDFSRLRRAMDTAGLVPSGPPRVTWVVVRADGGTTFSVAVPVTDLGEPPAFDDAAISLATSRPGRHVRFAHHGPHACLPDTYARAGDWLVRHGVLTDAADWGACMPVVEEYVTDPLCVPPDDLVTNVFVPIPTGMVLRAIGGRAA